MKYIILIVILGITYFSEAQIETTKKTTNVYDFEESNPSIRSIAIPVDFNDDDLLGQIPDSLNDLAIQRVDLVYTMYALNPTFNQGKLNTSRLSKLQKKWPEAKNKSIYWQEVGQTAADSPKSAKGLFHGFVIYYRPTPTAESVKAEIDFIDAIVSGKGVPEPPKSAEKKTTTSLMGIETKEKKSVDPKKTSLDHIPAEFDVKVGECYEIFMLNGNCKKKELENIQDSVSKIENYSGHTITWTAPETAINADYEITWLVLSEDCIGTSPETLALHGFGDWFTDRDYGIVKDVFERQPTWKNTHIVMDVTGSMSPYIAKTMAWLKDSQKSDLVTAFTFFNDGNLTPDNIKITGNVGGVYSIENSNFNAVYNELKSTMQKGGGGDLPENNIEATLKGIATYPNCDEIIMVADNFASPRDLALVKKLNVPVHVILCGSSFGGSNIDYIQLAYDTGGSIHTIEEDLDMKGIQPNKTIKIGHHYYTILEGKIIHVENKA